MDRTELGGLLGGLLTIAGGVLPWMTWSTGDRNAASLSSFRTIEVGRFVRSGLEWTVVLHPAQSVLVGVAGLALLGTVLLTRRDRRTYLATVGVGAVVVLVAAIPAWRLWTGHPSMVRLGDVAVVAPDVRPGIGLLAVGTGGLIAIVAGAAGTVAENVEPARRRRLAQLLGREMPWGALLAAGVLVVAVRYNVAALEYPVYRDAGAYLTVAAEILDGEVPYRDVIDHKPPGIYYLLAGLLAAGGDAGTAKLLALACNLGIAGLLVAVGRELWEGFAGLYAAAAYLLVGPLYGGAKIQTEPFVALFSLAAVLVAVRSPGDRRRLAVAGGFAGLATLFKQPGLAALGGLGLFVLAGEFGDPRSLARSLAAVVGGFLAPVLAVAASFAAVGAFGEFLFWSLLVNVGYVSHGTFPVAENVASQFDTMMRAWPVWALAAAGGAILVGDWWVDGRPDPGELAVVSIGVAAVAIIAVRPWPHYLIHPYPFAALVAGYVAHAAVTELEVHPQSARIGVVATLVLTGALVVPALENPDGRAAEGSLADQRETAALIDRHVGDDDRLLVFPAAPVYYYLLDAEPYDRNIYYLRANRDVSYTKAGLLQQLRRDPPDYVLVRNWECGAIPGVCAHVRSEYEVVGEYDQGLTLYRQPDAGG